MKKLSLFILLMASSVINAHAMWNGDEETSGGINRADLSNRQGQPLRVDEELVRYQFRGGQAYRYQGQVHHYEDGRRRVINSIDGDIVGHEGNRRVLVEPFKLSDTNKQAMNFEGDYYFGGDLEKNLQISNRENGRLIYSDGAQCYRIPTKTQERWRRDDRFQAGFFIATYNIKSKVNFLQSAVIPNGHLSEGLYALVSVENKETGREETWQRLGNNPEEIKINVPSRCSSIPGMGTLAPMVVPNKPQIPNGVIPEADIVQLGAGLNRYFSDYLKLEGTRRLIHYSRVKIDQHQGTSAGLRQEFTTLANTLHGLRNMDTEAPINFVNSLRAYMNVSDLEAILTQIGGLKNQNQVVVYQVDSWAAALDETIIKLRNLATSPVPTFIDGVLTLKGTFLGASDLKLAHEQYPTANQIFGFGLNTLYLDIEEEWKAPGVSVNLIAPKWRFVKPFKLDLSGLKGSPGNSGGAGVAGTPTEAGKPGGDGSPGNPGMNGGLFYGKMFTAQKFDLNFKSNGGKGGAGGEGGAGGRGADGKEGNKFKKTNKKGNVYLYQDKGTNGTRGGNGGKGGKEGNGGFAGKVIIEGHAFSPNSDFLKRGEEGAAGNPGREGRGGTHGKHSNARSMSPPEDVRKNSKLLTKIDKKHFAARGKALDGVKPTTLNSKDIQTPLPIGEIDKDDIKSQYLAWFQQQSVIATVNPFMRVFPGFSEPQ